MISVTVVVAAARVGQVDQFLRRLLRLGLITRTRRETTSSRNIITRSVGYQERRGNRPPLVRP